MDNQHWSSSGTSAPADYEVFINFRGKDTRDRLIDVLKIFMGDSGIRYFYDDESMRTGDVLSEKLIRSIERSQVYLVVLSESYAESKWCLRELAHMVKCYQEESKYGRKVILPIFYGVSVETVKLEDGSAYKTDMKKLRVERKVLWDWEEALKMVPKFKGLHKGNIGAGDLGKMIVREVQSRLQMRPLSYHMVGIDEQAQKVEEMLDVGSGDVRFLVIYGKEGIGKTTLARVVFWKLSARFQGSSFIADVTEMEKRSSYLYLQHKLLRDICGDESNDDQPLDIKESFRDKEVLIVLDGVEHWAQINEQVGSSTWFGPGSRIIITSSCLGVQPVQRDMQERNSNPAREFLVYEMKEMGINEASKLFSRYAFWQDSAWENYQSSSRRIVQYSYGIPLILEIMGSLLHRNRNTEEWTGIAQELENSRSIREKLMISYNKLQPNAQKIFLDIAGFFVNDEIAKLKYKWNDDGDAEGIEALLALSLVKIVDGNRLWMHDSLRDLGRSIALQIESPAHCRSMDDTLESVISEVHQTLKVDELLGLDAGNVDVNPGTSATPFEVVLSSTVYEEVAASFYKHMKDAGIRVFGFGELLDEDEETDKEFVRAINNSEICIPFFTDDYLASARCLRQLTHIMEARRNIPGQQVIPIFYDVEPSDVKLETDLYIKALKEHEQNFPTEVSRWKEALREVAELQGWKFKAKGFRRNIKFIMISVLNKLKEKHRSVLVGMQDQLEKLKEVLDVESQDVRFVGIYGIGGVGKTTLAKAVFDQLSTHFEGCSFLKDIRETAKFKGLRYLQDQLFRDITCANNDCETMTTRHIFLEKKVIIILDDVNERGQIKKLVGKANQFVSGSRIIITTRDINVLAVEHETLDGRILEFSEEVRSFKMGEMESAEALQLFCCHAFGKVYPPLDYLHICEEVVSIIGKLPLALEIMGSFLNHKPKSLWEVTLEKLKNLPDHELHTKLMISYEALDLETKEVFLDIACFFTGQDKTTPSYMWEACKLLPELGIEALTFLSFVKILGDNRLWMHNEVRDFGRKIICGGFIEDSAKWSRLWVNEEIMDILRSKKVNKNIQGLRLMFDEFLQDSTSPPLKLKSLPNLRFLEFSGFPFAMKRALPKLRWLSWYLCPQHVKASELYLKNLVILDLSNSYVSDQLGESGQLEMAKHLKVLDLTNCKRLTRTPIFSDGMILERLILEGCENLVKIDSSIGNLKQLMYLNLNGCYSLEELPNELGSATALTELIIKGNGQPFKLQGSLVGLTSLSVLEIDNLEIVDPVMHIGNSKKLEHLILSKCSGLKKLSESDQFFALLVKLDLSGSEIICLPDSIGEMKNLKVINVESSMICELPVSIGNLEKLEELHAKKCRSLKGEIPNEIGALSSLGILDLSFTGISSLPTTLSNLSNLQTLNLEFCDELEKLPELPTSLVSLHVMSKKLRTLPDLSKMNRLIDLKLFCPIDKFQADWFGKLSRLEKLELCIPRIMVIELGDTARLRSLSVSCKETGSLAQLPSTLSRLCLAHLNKNTKLPSLCNLKCLTFIEFYNCSIGDDEFKSIEAIKLESPEHLSACKCNFSWDYGLPLPERLRVLSLKECKLPSFLGLWTLKNLMHLELIDCQELKEIRGLDKLESLEEIIIYNCNSLENLGDISDLKKLKALQIHSCEMLREVMGLERMNTLKQLEICC